jgi:hypothetical protein
LAVALAHGAAFVDQGADANLGRELGDLLVDESELLLGVE